MIEDRPYLQLPIPSEEDIRLWEEWLEREKKKEEPEEDKIVIIEL